MSYLPDDENLRHTSPAAGLPYASNPGQFFLSSSSPTTQRHGYTTVPWAETRPRVSSASTIDTQSTTQHIGNTPRRLKSRSQRSPSTLSRTEEMLREWSTGVHWYVPTSMFVVFMAGCAGALGHHLFYSHLDGKPAVNQLMMNRYGIFLAFCTKAALIGAVVLAYRQRLWRTLREKAISVRALDALFSVVEDPSWFLLAPEMFMKARVASIMAIATWLIPIASVLSPGALTAQISLVKQHPIECDVHTINFTQEATADWRSPRYGQIGYNIAFFNTTPPPPAISKADWYDQPSYQAERITKLAFLSDQTVAEKSSPCPGYNCTYEIEFYAPWYNCTEVTFGLPASPLNIDDFVPASKPLSENIGEGGLNYIFKAEVKDRVEENNYAKPQKDYNSQDYTGQGTFRGDPDIYFGVVINTTKPLENIPENPRWSYLMVPHAYRCQHQKAKYTVYSNWTNTRLVNRTASISEGVSLLESWGLDSIGPLTDMEKYKEFVAYYTIGSIMRDIVGGQLVQDNQTTNIVAQFTRVTQTRLVNQKTQYPAKDFIHAFEDFYEDLVMSFISEPFMEIANMAKVKCFNTRWENRFRYTPQSLWIGYSIAIFVSFCCVVIGSLSISYNGMCSDTTFSKIMVTTRNPTLDKLIISYPGVALGGDPMPKELERTELRFGVIDVDQSGESAPLLVKHTAFGLVKETTLIDKQDVRRTLEVQEESDIELGSRGIMFSGAGLGALPG